MAARDTIRLGDADQRRRAGAPENAGATLVIDLNSRVLLAPVDAGTSVVIGRDDECDVVVDDGSLSRRHARFSFKDTLTVEDLGSTNGTRVNGLAIAPHTPTALASADEVTLGEARVSVQGAVFSSQRRNLVPHERFVLAVDDEAARARVFGRSFTVAFMRANESGASLARLARAAVASLRAVDRAAAFSDDVLELLLVELGPEEASDVVANIARDAGGGVRASAVAKFPDDGVSGDALVAAALAALSSAKPSGAARRAEKQTATSSPIVTAPAMAEVMRTVDKIARSLIPVLLVGETGSGKEVIARQIHERSTRKQGPFIAVNCGAVPQNLVESTLFGHEKGAFTGAVDTHKGVFEAAEGGVVFLDEIGELPAAAQTALLRVLETKRITRVGANNERNVDVRVLAATHRDLDAMVAAGSFREDLLYRLNAMTLAVPSLRERSDDIEPLARTFIDAANARHGRSVAGLGDDAKDLLLRYRWPGNVRELKNAIERAVVIASSSLIEPDDLPDAVSRSRDAETSAIGGPSLAVSLGEQVDRYEAKLILEALDRCGQNVTETARFLQLPKRTLQSRMKLLGISRKASYGRG
jgi:DNA-binding NtrC family response regulator